LLGIHFRSKDVPPVSTNNTKITDFFNVRRSHRKTSKQIEMEVRSALESAILLSSNEKFLEIYECKEKGRGIRSLKDFQKNDFVIEYKGELIDSGTARAREKKYAEDSSIGSFMYFFNYGNKHYCVDATEETVYKGRLINHSVLHPNLKTKIVEIKGTVHLILVAKRDIKEGEELLYDYGDRTPLTVANNPWLLNS
ncbi:unnamed protein product, partial [Enterobius vermicularis]|uniref:[histone H4]-lysine(20) N-methyltransferase n=1 Tax=Enterobius vermicularis TaxID=51028 RepID=A0A0N4UYE3_ENTVE